MYYLEEKWRRLQYIGQVATTERDKDIHAEYWWGKLWNGYLEDKEVEGSIALWFFWDIGQLRRIEYNNL
jgi:hypothetical protein